MQDFMRKHRKLILGFILVVICVPFIFFFGMPAPEKQRMQNDPEVMNIGGVSVKESEFRRNLDQTAAMMGRGQEQKPTYEEMDKAGTVTTVIDQMVDSSLISMQERERNFSVNEKVLQSEMQKWDMFKDDKGNFNPKAFNEWVGNMKGGWEPLYDNLRRSISRQVYLNVALAPGRRVSDSAINEELEADYTKLSIKYAKIDPPVTPTEEQIQKQFNDNQEKYRRPANHVAEFVSLSLIPEVPQKALDAVKEAREGADFAELVKKYSDVAVPEGGDLGWRPADGNVAEHVKPLLALAVGQVSDPIYGPTGYVIYKVDEERTNSDTNQREIHGRQIVINATLDEVKRAELTSKANQLTAKARETGGLAAAAQEAGLTVLRTNMFTKASMDIENVARVDAPQFRAGIIAQTEEKAYDPIIARNNIYVAKVVEKVEGDIPPLEEVRAAVTTDATNAEKRTDAYKAKVTEIADRIKNDVKSIDEIPTKFPELKAEVKSTTAPFTRKEMLYNQQIYLQTTDIFDKLGKAELGTMAGPLQGFLGDTWFVQLTDRKPPTDEDKAKWNDERKQRRQQAERMQEYAYLNDYTKDLRTRVLEKVKFTTDEDVVNQVLGRGKYARTEEKAAEGEGEAKSGEGEIKIETPANTTTAPAPAPAVK